MTFEVIEGTILEGDPDSVAMICLGISPDTPSENIDRVAEGFIEITDAGNTVGVDSKHMHVLTFKD